MRLIYIRHTVIETKLVVECCTRRLKCKSQYGGFPDNEFRVASMTFGQVREFLTSNTVLCESIVVLLDGTWLETVDTEIGTALINQSINPASCVKIIGLYSDDWDDQAAEKALPLSSPLLKEVGIKKLSVAFASSNTGGPGSEPILVDQHGLVDSMVDCINKAMHIVLFLPRSALLESVRQVKESPAKRKDVLFTIINLESDTSMSTTFDKRVDLSPIFQSASYLMTRPSEDIALACSVGVAVDADAGFTTLPIKRVGLVVYSHLAEPMNRTTFNCGAGVSAYPTMLKLVSHRQIQSQHQSCRGIQATHLCLYNGDLKTKVAHPVDHSKEFVIELIRGWPGKSMSEMPLDADKIDVALLGRTLDHLAAASIIEPHERGYKITSKKGAEVVDLLPSATKYGLSFELVCLLASVRHCVTHERSMRLLIRLAVLGGQADDFLSGLDKLPVGEGIQTVSWDWIEETRQHMAGPARGHMLGGRLWFAVGIWDKMRRDTENFSVPMPREDGELEAYEQGKRWHHIQGVGKFHCQTAVEVYTSVLELEDRVGLPLLAPSDPEWEVPLRSGELHEVQFQSMLAFISELAVWDIDTGEISLIGSRRAITLAPSCLVAHPQEVERKPERGYLILPDQIKEGPGRRLSASSASCVPMSLLRMISHVLGEPAMDWLRWP